MALGFTGIVATRHSTAHVIDARYHLVPTLLILTASGAQGLIEWVQERLPNKERLIALCIGGLVVASSSLTMASAWLRTTMNQEYDFVREYLPAIPNGCAIVAYEPDFDLGLRAPFHLSANLGLEHHWILKRSFMPADVAGHECALMQILRVAQPCRCFGGQKGQDGMCAMEG